MHLYNRADGSRFPSLPWLLCAISLWVSFSLIRDHLCPPVPRILIRQTPRLLVSFPIRWRSSTIKQQDTFSGALIPSSCISPHCMLHMLCLSKYRTRWHFAFCPWPMVNSPFNRPAHQKTNLVYWDGWSGPFHAYLFKDTFLELSSWWIKEQVAVFCSCSFIIIIIRVLALYSPEVMLYL